MKKFYIILVLIVAVIAAGIIYVSWQYTRTNKNVAAESPDFSLTPEALISEVKADRSAAIKKYTDKIISLNGQVGEKENNDIFFEKDGISIQCEMKKEDAGSIKPNDNVKVKAKFVGVIDDDIAGTEIQMNNGVLVLSDK